MFAQQEEPLLDAIPEESSSVGDNSTSHHHGRSRVSKVHSAVQAAAALSPRATNQTVCLPQPGPPQQALFGHNPAHHHRQLLQ